jgi:ankyrin repeat protein
LVNSVNGSGETALYVACLNGRSAVATALLERDADPRLTVPESKNTALHAVAFSSARFGCEIIPELLARGADVNSETFPRSLVTRRISALTSLVGASAHGCSPLHVAAFGGSLECCALLLELKADPTIRSRSGLLAVDVACLDSVKDLLKQLVATRNQRSNSLSVGQLTPRRHSIAHCCDTQNPDELLGLVRSSGSRSSISPSQKTRAQRERSVSSPFLNKRASKNNDKQ